MIEATKDRLEEARFFLDKLRQEKKRQEELLGTNPQEFRYYVHAFLSAARSVRWVLQCDEPEKYKAWTDTWAAKDSLADKDLLKLMNDQRVAVTHRRGAETTPVSEKVAIRESAHPAAGSHFFGPPGMDPPWTILDVHYFEFEGKREEVVTTCERYVEYLDRMLKDFMRAHPE
jgi:hypothetical protein